MYQLIKSLVSPSEFPFKFTDALAFEIKWSTRRSRLHWSRHHLHRPSCSLLIYLVLDIDLGVQPSITLFYAHYRCFDTSSSSPSLSTHSDQSRRYLSSHSIDLYVSASSQASIIPHFIHSLSLSHVSVIFLIVYLFPIRFVELYASTRWGHRAARSRFDLIEFASKLVSLHRFYCCFVLYTFYTL
jgi:hypothetical protein